MTEKEISPDEAARALSEVVDRQRQVAEMADLLPPWHLAVLVGLGVLFFAQMDVPHWPGSTPVGLAIVALWGVVPWLLSRRRRVVPHPSLWGVRGWLLIGGVFAAIFVLANAAERLIEGRHVPLPHTITGVVLGVLVGVAGVLLNRWLKWIMVSRSQRVAR
jgi:hypothetical protein